MDESGNNHVDNEIGDIKIYKRTKYWLFSIQDKHWKIFLETLDNTDKFILTAYVGREIKANDVIIIYAKPTSKKKDSLFGFVGIAQAKENLRFNDGTVKIFRDSNLHKFVIALSTIILFPTPIKFDKIEKYLKQCQDYTSSIKFKKQYSPETFAYTNVPNDMGLSLVKGLYECSDYSDDYYESDPDISSNSDYYSSSSSDGDDMKANNNYFEDDTSSGDDYKTVSSLESSDNYLSDDSLLENDLTMQNIASHKHVFKKAEKKNSPNKSSKSKSESSKSKSVALGKSNMKNKYLDEDSIYDSSSSGYTSEDNDDKSKSKDKKTKSESEKSESGNESEIDEYKAMIPIMIVPCKKFQFPEVDDFLKEGDKLTQYFVDHYNKCNKCEIINNNNKEPSKYFTGAELEYEESDIYDPDIDDEIESYHNMKDHDCFGINETFHTKRPKLNTPQFKIKKISNSTNCYNNCILLLWSC